MNFLKFVVIKGYSVLQCMVLFIGILIRPNRILEFLIAKI
jgi:hypothetical protein